MFFMFGTWPGVRQLGTVDGYQIIMTYYSIMVFFLPLFKFNKQYFATDSQGRVFQLNADIGQAIERGEEVHPGPRDMQEVRTGAPGGSGAPAGGFGGFSGPDIRVVSEPDSTTGQAAGTSVRPAADPYAGKGKICMRCGFTTDDESMKHCPDCGNLLVHQD